MVDPIIIESDILSRTAMLAQKTYIRENLPKVDLRSKPLLQLCESIKEYHGPSGEDGAISDAMLVTPELDGQFYRGSDTIIDPQVPNIHQRFETIYWRHVLPIRFDHDEWLQHGYLFKAHGAGSLESRVRRLGEERLQKLSSDLVNLKMKGVNDRFNVLIDLALHKMGSSYKEPVGLNAQFNLAPLGSLYGQNRLTNPFMQHYVKGSTIGTGGTLIADLREMFRYLNTVTAECGLDGKWIPLAGGGWLQAYGDECERIGISRQADVGGLSKADFVLLDSSLRVGGLKPVHDPTWDTMDSVCASEKGLAISPNAVTFSGGGSPTRQAQGVALMSAAGVLQDIIVTDPGEGYTEAPTCAVATLSGETIACTVFGDTAGAGITEVEADDSRIGKLATVTVSVGGTGGTAGDAPDFTDRCLFVFLPALKYKAIKGLEREVTIPADPARERYTEVQLELAGYFYNRMPRAFALSYIKR